jgi:4-amino-4-deoxy-L-arabinose transferase-like glycosyltransferase
MSGKKEKNQSVSVRYSNTIALTLIVLFLAGAILRISLCWWNPTVNAFDDHWEPILMMMTSGSIPAKDACWQCYNPPVFYIMSAAVGKCLMAALGLTLLEVEKPLHFLNCIYGILSLVFIYLVLKRFVRSGLSIVIAFGVVCFLPRHIYMSAMNSNDSISYLFVALSVYLFVITIEKKLSVVLIIGTSIALSIALFTKYTTYALLPAIGIPLLILLCKNSCISRPKVFVMSVILLILPAALLANYFVANYRHYGALLPWNLALENPTLNQPQDYDEISYFSFKPWDGITQPFITPGKMHSFWTLIYNGMWFDNQPRFLQLMDSNSDWWVRYYAWLRGETEFPGQNDSVSFLTRLSATSLITLGLLPLILVIKGAYHYSKQILEHWSKGEGSEVARMSVLPILLVGNAAIAIALVERLPVFSAIKSSYFLNCLPVLAVFLGYGFAPLENSKIAKKVAILWVGLLFALVSVHTIHICWALQHHLSKLQPN